MPKVLSAVRALLFGSAGSQAVAVGVSGDTDPRLRIDAGGRLTWGTGAAAGDIYVERNGVNSLLVSGEVLADSYQVDTTATPTGAVAKLIWNDTDGTLNLGLKGGNVTLPVGQAVTQRVSNVTGSAMSRGQAVRLAGAQGNRTTVALALADSDLNSSKTFGVLTEAIADNQSGFVITEGIISNLNTSALTEGAIVWLSPGTAGGLTTTKPSAPNHLVMVGLCVKQSAGSGILLVKVQNGYELDELHDVAISSPTNGQVLTYDSALSLWKNANATGGGSSVSVGDTAPASPNSGDLWFNSSNLKSYIYYDSFWVEIGGGAGGGGSSVTVSDVAPSSPNPGDLWFDSTSSKTFIYYDSYWVESRSTSALTVSGHTTTHVRGGADIIDGDRLQVDYVPSAYTRDTASAGAGAATDLTAHLGGIDDYLMSATGRNRIINGFCRIDQRYSNASRTIADGQFAADRFRFLSSLATITSQCITTDGPPGVSGSSIKFTVATAGSVSSGSYMGLDHNIEGYNVADFAFGTANAQPVVLSFYVKSSQTGTYSIQLRNGASNRSYVTTYTINAANTWERKSITLTGDTTGTWYNDHQIGLMVRWTLTAGSTYETATLNAWQSGDYLASSSSIDLATINGATWQLSGAQLEYGTAPTRFEVRPYDDELRRCQRYFERYASASPDGTVYPPQFPCNVDVANRPEVMLQYQRKRVAPTITVSSGTGFNIESITSSASVTTTGYSGTLVGTGVQSANLFFTGTWTAYVPGILVINSNQYIDILAEF